MLTIEVGSSWEQAENSAAKVSSIGWSAVQAKSAASSGAWSAGTVAQSEYEAAWSTVASADVRAQSDWQAGSVADGGNLSAWNQLASKDLFSANGWDKTLVPHDLRLRLIYNPFPERKDAGRGEAWNRCDEFGERLDENAQRLASLYVPGGRPLEFEFFGARYTPGTAPAVFFDFRYLPSTRAIQPVDSETSAGYGSALVMDGIKRLPWGWGQPSDPIPTGIEYPDYPGPIVVIDPPPEPDILETYMIANTVTLAVLSSGTPLDATSIKVSRDIDSFSWTFSAELFGRTSLNLVRPDANGPKTVELFINGWRWLFLVEKYSGQGKFPSERYTISGGSRVQLLAEPYAPKRSTLNSAQVNARQAAEDELLDTGFTITWDTISAGPPDWTLPAGAYSYQGQTALQVIAKIAEVVGGVVSPARDSDALTILPRYREAVWNWDGAVMDRIIPAEVVSEWGSEWSPQPEWNTVYVSGTNYGVGVQVRRSGTAGDDPAADVMEDWMTGTDAARSRGISELSKGGNQEIVTLNLPLFPAESNGPGLIEPAMLCEVRDPDETWRGLCLGVDISADGVGASKVSQSLRLERHHAGGA